MMSVTVTFALDRSGWWVAQGKEVPEAITQGRTIVEAERRFREALALVWDDETKARGVALKADIRLPNAELRQLVERSQRATAEREKAQALAKETMGTAVRALKQYGFSLRDMGTLLNLKGQRVHQIVQTMASKRKSRVKRMADPAAAPRRRHG
jgi:predicted RNase H-like HicB family nuclease